MPGNTSRENGKKGGRPVGSKSVATIEKEAVERAFKNRVMSVANTLLGAQMSLAKGQSFLYKIETKTDAKGKSYREKPELVTDEGEIQTAIDRLENSGSEIDIDDDTYYYITTKEPNNQALDSLFNRVFGKPAETVKIEEDIRLRIDA